MFHPADVGKFYTPKEIADELVALAKRKHLNQLRVSGGEPTIGKRHLLELLDQLQNKGYNFILETNGILIGHDENYAQELSKYDFIHARVSLKGCNQQEFATLTGAKPEDYTLQLKSLQHLVKAGVSCHPSVMISFSSNKNLQHIIEQLKQINPRLDENLELEELILYPHVNKRLQKHNLKPLNITQPKQHPTTTNLTPRSKSQTLCAVKITKCFYAVLESIRKLCQTTVDHLVV